MAARFTQGTSTATTRSIKQESRVPISRGSGKGKAGGMPGYIKTAQDKSSGGLTSAKPVGPRFNEGETSKSTSKTVQMRDQGAYIGTRAKPGQPHYRGGYGDYGKGRGSSDKSYYKTSTDKAGTIRVTGKPMAPAKRSVSEMETSPGGTTGSRTAVSNGGVRGANKLPPQGISADQTGKNHISGSGHSAAGKAAPQLKARNGGTQGGLHGKQFVGGGKGTMESLRGKVNPTKSMGMGKRSGSQMY